MEPSLIVSIIVGMIIGGVVGATIGYIFGFDWASGKVARLTNTEIVVQKKIELPPTEGNDVQPT